MELEQLQAGLANYEELKKAIEKEKVTEEGVADMIKVYDLKNHAINDLTKRPDKVIETETGPSVAFVTRIAVPLQKLIVSRAAAFLCGNPVELQANAQDDNQKGLLAVLKKTWDDNKLDYDSKKLAKLMMSQTECAEIWYTEPADELYWKGTPNEGTKFRLRMKIVAPSFGDALFPVFNAAGDMIAFGRSFTTVIEGKKAECFDLYTDVATYKGIKSDTGWAATNEANPVGKIPVIYYSQLQPEWADVQSMIDRLEKVLSNHGDTNDYFGSPMVAVQGEVKGFSKKGESGKVLELTDGAKAEYLEWNSAPESVKLETDNLRSLIFDMTDTPDISIEQMKALGTYSGVALKMLFLGAHLKAADKEETFGKCIQRRINYLKVAHAKLNVKLEEATLLSIKPKFEYFLPKNDQEKIGLLTEAVMGKILSRKTGVEQNPLVHDAVAELAQIEAEGKAAGALNDEL